MPKYLVSWTEETFFNTYVEADSEDEALNSFFDNVDNCWDRAKIVGSEVQDSIEVEAIEQEAIYG